MARAITIAGVALAAVAIAILLLWLRSDTENNPSESRHPGSSPAADVKLFSEPSRFASEQNSRFNCEPYDPIAGLSEEESLEAWRTESTEIVRQLSSSDDAEHLVVAAMMQRHDNPNQAFELLDRASATAGNNPLVTWNWLQICTLTGDICTGRLGEIERRAIAVDGGNAALWASIANIRQKRGDSERALEALRKAVGSPEYNVYYGEQVLMYDRALAAASEKTSFDRIGTAFNFAASTPNAEINLFTRCRDEAENSVEWRDYCLRLGETMEGRGKTILHMSVGLSMQSAMYGIEGDEQQQRIVDEKRARLSERIKRISSAEKWITSTRDESLFRAYTDVFISAGELAAIDFAEREVERLNSMPGFDPCK